MSDNDKELQRLYQKQIITWSQKPQHKQDLSGCSCCATVKNPMCGDIISVAVDGPSSKMYWDGEGCMICFAAAEAFCKHYNDGDLSAADAQKIIDEYHKNEGIVPEFSAFQSIKEIPQRTKCVTLVAKAVQKLDLE